MTELMKESLIAAKRVNGTNVYNPAGDKLGEIEDVMLDKVSGNTCYAVLSFGGFMGMGEKQYPLPWNTLKYDTGKGGYVVNINIDKKFLQDAPTLDEDRDVTWTPDYGRNVDKYYGGPSLWP